jgi:hypothetical protein
VSNPFDYPQFQRVLNKARLGLYREQPEGSLPVPIPKEDSNDVTDQDESGRGEEPSEAG